MKKNLMFLVAGLCTSLLLLSCNKSGKSDSDSDSTSVAQQDEADAPSIPDYDMSRPLVFTIQGDTTVVNEYDAEGRLIKTGYMRDGEEGGDASWYSETFTYDKDGYLLRTDNTWGEWDNWEKNIYDDQHRIIRKESKTGYTIHYTWDGLTCTDDGFCVEQLTYSDKTYKHVVCRRGFISNNGPISSETTYDEQGLELRITFFTDGVATSAIENQYADNKCMSYRIQLNADGTEAERTPSWVTEYYPNGKYNKVTRTYMPDGSMEGYTQQYDELGRPVHMKNDYEEYDILWEGNTSTYTNGGQTFTTTYHQIKK